MLCLQMKHIFRSLLLIFLLISCIFAQTTVNNNNGNDQTVRGCQSHCFLDTDEGLSCWKETLSFYEIVLLSHLRSFVGVEANIDEWHRRNRSPINLTLEQEESVNAMLEEKSRIREGTYSSMMRKLNEPLVTEDLIHSVVHTVITTAANGSHNGTTNQQQPEVSCPIPCEQNHATYIWLFVASVIVNIVMALIVIPFIIKTFMRDSEASVQKSPLVKN